MTERLPPTAEEFEHRLNFERLLMSVSTQFMHLGIRQLDTGITHALQQIGSFCRVDRAYVFLFAGATLSNTHEWCAEGVEAQIGNLQELPVSAFTWWMGRMQHQDVIHIPRVKDMPDEAAAERNILMEHDVVSVMAVPMVFEGRALGFMGFDSVREGKIWRAEDITLLRIAGEMVMNALERKRAEEERRVLEEQLVQARSLDNVARLAGGVAHDFNNLLSVIVSYAYALTRELTEPRPREYADMLRQAAEQAAALTRQLMFVGRRDAVQSEILDANQVLQSLEHLLTRTLGEAVEFTLRCCDEPCWVELGKAHVEQVIVNLVVNARDATLSGGRVLIETACILSGLEPGAGASPHGAASGPWVRLRVADTGVGMSAEVASQAFEPFFSTKGTAGTGLGLSTVHGIVTRAHGHVRVDSRLGAGTTVDVYLPRVTQSPTSGEAVVQASAPARGRGERILLVEDYAPLCALIERLLVDQGYRVLSAAHPADALELAAKEGVPLDLLLTDLILPGMSGRKLAEILVQRHPALRVAYMSGHDDDVLVRHGVVEDGTLLLLKPFSDAKLLEFTRRALDAAGAPVAGQVARTPGSEH